MTRRPARPLRLVPALALLLLAAEASAQGRAGAPQAAPGAAPQGGREAMWPAPTAEDWKKPCLITWQRSFEDALEVSRESGRPILVCVNMDGEIASEHYAGVRYRSPEIAALYEPYVCVIASVYRHTPRDHDEEGRRILCPRFGSVTCGEHIAIEPGLFERYFEGERVAPRHIMVELDRSETYDVYYAFDTASVFEAIRRGIAEREHQPTPLARGDRAIEQRVASRDIADRVAVETAYLQGSREVRRKLIGAALESPDAAPVELLRLAIYDLDVELNRLARQALSRTGSESAVDLIADALRVPMEAAEREALLAALARLGESSEQARRLAVVFEGLASRSGPVDVGRWSRGLEGLEAGAAAADWRALGARIEYQAQAARGRPEDAQAQLELSESYLALAVDPETSLLRSGNARDAVPDYEQLLLEDCLRAALRAEELGARGWRVDAAVALASYYLRDVEQGYARAERAVAELPPGEEGWNAMAVLALFAEARRDAIAQAVRRKEDWPREWMADVHSAYSVLARHPLGADVLVAAHYDFLVALKAVGQATQALHDGLRRFPDSWILHDRLRARLLADQGADDLEAAFEDRLREAGVADGLDWFVGYTSIVAAEFHRRAGRDEPALEAYARALERYRSAAQARPEWQESCDHYAALALAGRARVRMEQGDLDRALAELLASLERREEAAATLDGLSFSAVITARTLQERLRAAGREDEAARVAAVVDALDPELLRPPEFERASRGRGPSPDARRFGGRRPQGTGR